MDKEEFYMDMTMKYAGDQMKLFLKIERKMISSEARNTLHRNFCKYSEHHSNTSVVVNNMNKKVR